MTTEVWGTFSVRDHIRREAFLREVLLFDRLLVPYPDPLVAGERDRWRQPNPENPAETWNPDRLDDLLGILGTEDAPGWNGAQLVQRAMWSPATWTMLRSRLEVADAATGNPWMDTRLGIRNEAPGVVEAVAAYPSEDDWRRDIHPLDQQPADMAAAEALVQLARPFLLPAPQVDEMDPLRQAVELAQDPDFRRARVAYFEWFRQFMKPLLAEDVDLAKARIDAPSLTLAQNRLRELWDDELKIIKRADRARWFSRIEIGCVTLGTAGTVALAAAAALPAVGVPAALLTFAGWSVARLGKKPDPEHALGGASLFLNAHRRLGWLEN